jgi:hypothetical protein
LAYHTRAHVPRWMPSVECRYRCMSDMSLDASPSVNGHRFVCVPVTHTCSHHRHHHLHHSSARARLHSAHDITPRTQHRFVCVSQSPVHRHHHHHHHHHSARALLHYTHNSASTQRPCAQLRLASHSRMCASRSTASSHERIDSRRFVAHPPGSLARAAAFLSDFFNADNERQWLQHSPGKAFLHLCPCVAPTLFHSQDSTLVRYLLLFAMLQSLGKASMHMCSCVAATIFNSRACSTA